MKAPSKLHNKSQHLAKIGGLALAVALLGILPVTAQNAPIPATTTMPNATAKSATTTTVDPKNAANTANAASSEEASSDLTNWVTLGVGSTFVSGDNGNFSHQKDVTNSGPYGGVDDFHWQQFLGKEATLTVDGHAIFGNHDYDLKLDLTDEKLGYIRGGYQEFRTWYDNNGGYDSQNGLSFVPYASDLYVDRRIAWVEAGLTLPDLPVFVFRYDYDSREGQMDSTSWNQTTLTPGAVSLKLVPAFQDIDETRHIFSFDVKDKIDNTDADLGFRYEMDRTNDSTYSEQSPTQAAQAFVTQNDLEKNDLFTLHGSSETVFDKNITYSTGFSVTTMDTTLGGDRIYGPAYNSPVMSFANNGAGFVGLYGGGDTKDYVGNMNLMLTPITNLTIVPAVRVEYEGTDLVDHFSSTSGTGPTQTPEVANSNDWTIDVAQSLEARYTGFRDWSLYASGEWSEDWGNDEWDANPILNTINQNQNFSMLGQKYTVGANWYPLAQLNFGTQYYHQVHDYSFDNINNGLHSGTYYTPIVQYPGYLQGEKITTDDMNIRCTWQALSTVSLITRYDFQYSTVDTLSNPYPSTVQATEYQSSNTTNNILSESVNWTPLSCLYLQVGGSYVLNSVDTGLISINNLVLNGQNNYWTLDASAGYSFDDKTRLQVDYSYYNADDYYADLPTSVSYGAGAQENSVTATVTREISKSVDVSVKYGFYRYRDQTDGGLDNYDAQLVYVSTRFKF